MRKNICEVCVSVLICFLLGGCQAVAYGTAEKLNHIAVGMTKDQVIKELGMPDTTSASDTDEIMKFKWMKTVVSWAPKYFYVRLVDGKVQSYGEESEMKTKP